MNLTGQWMLLGTGVLALALAGIIADEAMTTWTPPDRPAHADPPLRGPQQPEAAGPADQSGRWLREVLGRPVFSPDRRPPASSAAGVSGLSRLTGVVVTGTEKLAIFAASAAGGHALSAHEGEHVGAYEVREITVAGVKVSGPEGTAIMTPVFDPAPPPVGKVPRPLVPPVPMGQPGVPKPAPAPK